MAEHKLNELDVCECVYVVYWQEEIEGYVMLLFGYVIFTRIVYDFIFLFPTTLWTSA